LSSSRRAGRSSMKAPMAILISSSSFIIRSQPVEVQGRPAPLPGRRRRGLFGGAGGRAAPERQRDPGDSHHHDERYDSLRQH
jgi:hypothetical protein